MSTRDWNCPYGRAVYPCAVSGGTLREYLLHLNPASCLCIAPRHMEYPLPCPDGVGRSLSRDELKTLYQNQPVHYSTQLCMEYFTYFRDGQLHLVLFDTLRSLKEKYRLARELHLPHVCIPDRALRRELTGR